MSTRQQRAQRKRWAHYSRAYRRRKKLMDEQSTAAASTIMGRRASSSRKLVGRHRVCIARSKVARELLKTQEELRRRERQLQQQKVLTAKYRQRLHRTSTPSAISSPSSATKVRRMTAKSRVSPKI